MATDSNETTVAVKRLAKLGGGVGHRLHLGVRPDLNAPSYLPGAVIFTLRLTVEDKEGNTKRTEEVEVPGYVRAGHTDAIDPKSLGHGNFARYSDTYAPRKGSWSLYGCSSFGPLVALLPNHAKLRFEIALDDGTNPLMVKARLHGDVLKLVAEYQKGGKTVSTSFHIDQTNSAHNTARFGFYNETYSLVAERA